jgi:hypothetical protein
VNALLDTVAAAATYTEIRSALAEAEAESRGCAVVKPRPNELFVDIDSEEAMSTFRRQLEVFKRMHSHAIVRMGPSPSGLPGHFHIYVTLTRDVDAVTRILYQSLLGSDPMREILSYQRLDSGDECPTLFFEKKELAP